MSTSKKKTSPWTQFMDMHSGGGQKLDWSYIYIEAPQEEAERIFYAKFGRNPQKVSCTCCGSDYSVSESESLAQATAYNRGCDFAYFNAEGKEIHQSEAFISGKGMKSGTTDGYVERKSTKAYSKEYVTLEEYKKKKEIKIIPKNKITPTERVVAVPDQGYVWQGD